MRIQPSEPGTQTKAAQSHGYTGKSHGSTCQRRTQQDVINGIEYSGRDKDTYCIIDESPEQIPVHEAHSLARQPETLGNSSRSEVLRVIMAVSINVSVPFPMAMLTSAQLKARASFTPSPTMATVLP